MQPFFNNSLNLTLSSSVFALAPFFSPRRPTTHTDLFCHRQLIFAAAVPQSQVISTSKSCQLVRDVWTYLFKQVLKSVVILK